MDNFSEASKQKVEFENELGQLNKYYSQRKTPKIITLVIKFSGGYVNNEQQANYVLLIFAVAAIIISFILFSGIDLTPHKTVQFREDIPLEVRKNLPPEVLESVPSKFN